jgi:Gpi18-like mannosyltransferase
MNGVNIRSVTWHFPRAWRTALIIFVAARVVSLIWVWGVRQVYTQPLPPDPVARPYLNVAPEASPWLEPWQRWDTLHYQAIAQGGYTAYGSALFTPPLYPVLMRWVGDLLGGRSLLAGIVIANVAFLLGLVALYRLAVYETADEQSATWTLIFLASFPAAFFLLAAYTEAVFLLGAIFTLLSVRQKRWWQAGLWGALAAATRLPGALIVVPVAYAAWEAWRKDRDRRGWLAVILILIGAVIFPMYVWLGLNLPPWTPLLVQNSRYAGGLTWPGLNLIAALQHVFRGQYVLADLLDLFFTFVFLICAVPVWRKLPRVYGVYYVTLMLLYLIRAGGEAPLLSMTRYVLVLFPAFLVWGIWNRHNVFRRMVLYASWFGWLFVAAQFAMWGWVG